MKKHAPATLRNREAIAEVLRLELPATGTVLEIASGSGEHAVFFAERFAQLTWQPSDPDKDAVASIAAYRGDYSGNNLNEPIMLDASAKRWPVRIADAILCVNMTHISPWAATIGLFDGAAKHSTSAAPLVLYGPYFEEGIEPAPSNVSFDQGLRARDQRWGIRRVSELDELAHSLGFMRSARYEMPAHNLALVYRRT
ncbi:MAG: DUF938 domain-containing protein [Pseudomonadota bacterium]